MCGRYAFSRVGAIAFIVLLAAGAHAQAQVAFGATPGYPSVAQYPVVGGAGGVGGYGGLGYNGFGTTPYSYPDAGYGYGAGVANGIGGGVPGFGAGVGGIGTGYESGIGVGGAPGIATGPGAGYNPSYQVGNGLPGTGVAGANTFLNAATPTIAPQTTLALQPLYNAINAVPALNQSAPRHAGRVRYRPQPPPPRSQMINDDGMVLWPSITPNDDSVEAKREAVDSAAKGLIEQAKKNGNASTRSVIDAKNKLHTFARAALPMVMTRSPADSHTLELFILHLGKAMEQLAVKY